MNYLSHMPHIAVWVAGSSAIAIAGLYISKRLFPFLKLHGNTEFINAGVSIVGALISVVLGLLVSTSVDQFHSMELNVESEAGAVADIFRLSRGLPAEQRKQLQDLCIDYCSVMVSDEWPQMEHGKLSDKVNQVYTKLTDQVLSVATDPKDPDAVVSALTDANQHLAECRRTRIASVTGSWTWRLLPVIILCSVLVLGLSYLYADEKPNATQLFVIILIAIAMGSNIGLLVFMSRPFDQAGLGPDIFQLTVTRMKAYQLRDTL